MADLVAQEQVDVSLVEVAKQMIRETFAGDERAAVIKDEAAMDRALKLCEAAGGLHVSRDGKSLVAGFLYWPQQGEAVADMRWEEFEGCDMTRGPILHIVCFIGQRSHGYRVMRRVIGEITCWGVTAHRWRRRLKEWRFVAQKNRRWQRTMVH